MRFLLWMWLLVAGAAWGQGIVVEDPAVKIRFVEMALLPGWHGQAAVDRTSDPMGHGWGTEAGELTSGDGQARIVLAAAKFWTVGTKAKVPQCLVGNCAGVPFTSTADLLTHRIVPALGIRGKMGPVEGATAEMTAKQIEQATASGVTGAIANWAVVTVVDGARETTVLAVTNGFGAGTDGEMTWTEITVAEAPVGQAEGILQKFVGLGKAQPGKEWVSANAAYVARRRMEEAAARRRMLDPYDGFMPGEREGQNHQYQIRDYVGVLRDPPKPVSVFGKQFGAATMRWCRAGGVGFETAGVTPVEAGWMRCE